MNIRTFSPALSITAQIGLDELAALAATGFASIINNRPDDEEAGQPRSRQMALAAARSGLAYRHIPITPGNITDADVEAFGRALSEMPHPVLAYCRTGTRAAALWALTEARRRPPGAILSDAANAGYDLEGLRPRLAAIFAEPDAERAPA